MDHDDVDWGALVSPAETAEAAPDGADEADEADETDETDAADEPDEPETDDEVVADEVATDEVAEDVAEEAPAVEVPVAVDDETTARDEDADEPGDEPEPETDAHGNEWIVAAVLGAAAVALGVIPIVLLHTTAGAVTQLQPELGFELLLPIFAAVVLGGIGNPFGALAGGIVLGLVTEWSTLLIEARWKTAVGFVILIIVLIYIRFAGSEALMGEEGTAL